MSPPFPILYEDNHLLVVVKPSGLATMGVASDRDSALAVAQRYIKEKYNKPGNVYLGVVSRLDAPVSGVLVFARTSKAAARLTEQFRGRDVEKIYWALVEGRIEPTSGTLHGWVAQDERHRRMHAVGAQHAGAKEARLSYRRQSLMALPAFDGRGGSQARKSIMAHSTTVSFVEIQLETGRKHQIRLQLAEHGFPIVGDRKYGSRTSFSAGIALHARRLAFTHPVRHTPIDLVAPLPPTWPRIG